MKRLPVRIKGACIEIACAKGLVGKALGLSMRRTLVADGMLFRFRRPARHAVWMLGMRFALDIVWVRKGKVVAAEHEVQPPANWWLSLLFPFSLKRYRPSEVVDAVLELPAGFCEACGVMPGDEVAFDG